jgi:hypothetical protein
MLVSIMEGQDPIGRETQTVEGIKRMIGEQSLPLAARDLQELYEENPLHAIMYGLPVMLGVSVNAGVGSREWLQGTVRADEAIVSKEIKDLRLNPPRPGRRVSTKDRTLTGDREYKSLTKPEYEAFEKTVMPEIYEQLADYVRSPTYTKLPREQRVRALNRRIRYYNRTKSAQRMLDPRDIKSEVRNRWWEDFD